MITKAKDVAHLRVNNAIKRNNLHYLWLYNTLCKVAIYSICLVICAGGFVRMTGSGMGCPDWPKCFGYWIPPTELSQLPNDYKQIYAERGYDELDFNPFNTWTEYINRLLGFVSGLFCLGLLIVSFLIKNKRLVLLSFLLVCLMGFQAWMGALVVYSVLAPFKITIHMIIALVIVSLVLFLYRITKHDNKTLKVFKTKWLWGVIIISMLQILLGTQVREGVDTLLISLQRSSIIEQLPFTFELHRSIAWLVTFSNIYLIYYYRSVFHLHLEFSIILGVIAGLFCSGILMSYHSIIGLYQLVHLLCAVSLFICQISILLKNSRLPIVNFP